MPAIKNLYNPKNGIRYTLIKVWNDCDNGVTSEKVKIHKTSQRKPRTCAYSSLSNL